jgi:CheY-like chemotaxis protein
MAANAKILIVEDDPDVVEAVTLVLESEGYQVSAAYDAEDGLAKVEADRPDLIVLDVMMPDGTEGFHFVWRLRNKMPVEVRDVPILMLTAIHSTTRLRFYPDSSDGTYQAGEYLPVEGFIDKPVDPAYLLRTVGELLGQAKERKA